MDIVLVTTKDMGESGTLRFTATCKSWKSIQTDSIQSASFHRWGGINWQQDGWMGGKYFQPLLSRRQLKEKQHWHWYCLRSASPLSYLLDIPIKVSSVQFPESPALLLHKNWVDFQNLRLFSSLGIFFCTVSLIWPLSCRARYREILSSAFTAPSPHQLESICNDGS